LKWLESNSLRKALEQSESSAHLDADMLTAFAEGALLPAEREAALAHLAACTECRNVLNIGMEDAGETPRKLKPFLVAHPGRPLMRILIPSLAAAATIVVVSAAVVRYQLRTAAQNPTVAVDRKDQSAQPFVPPQVSPPEEPERATRKRAPASIPPPDEQPPSPEPANAPKATMEESKTDAQPPADANSSMELRRTRPEQPISAFANEVTSHALAKAPKASVARPHWRLNEQGQPERALADGPWQPVLPNQSARMHVLSVFGDEVWVGGEKSQVFCSLDNGASWRLVHLPEKNGPDHAIANIRFDSAQEITIDTADGTTWATTDGGDSWK
jgi:putative zinc finger protein